MQNAPFFLVLLIGFLITFSQAITVDLGSNARGIVMDTRSSTLFISTDNTEIWSVENSDYVHKLTQLAGSGAANLAMVDFLHQDLGWMYGLLAATKLTHVVHFVSLTAGASPPAQANLFAGVAGVSGTSGSVDGVGGDARLNEPGWLAAAHTAPRWFVSTPPTRSIRGLEFPLGVGMQLNVSTVFTHATLTIDAIGISADDSVLYFYESAGSGDLFKLFDPLTTVGATSAVLVATSVAHACQMFVHPTADILLVANGSSDAYVVSTATGLIQSTVATSGLSRAAFVHPNGTELYGMAGATDNLHTHCCQTAYDFNWLASVAALPVTSGHVRDFARDTRSDGVFSAFYETGIVYLTLNPVSRTTVGPDSGMLFISVVDFIHCSGLVYGILISYQVGYKMSFLPLTPAAPGATPVGGTAFDVAGDGTSANVNGVGSAARFGTLAYIAAAHTAPVWMVTSSSFQNIRRVVFTRDLPLRLNVTTLIATPGKQTFGAVITKDDSVLYASVYNFQQIQTVLNPLSTNPVLGSVLSIVADNKHKISLHPGCESLLLVGCQVEYFLVYNITSQSTVRRIRAVEAIATDVVANGTVIFAMSAATSLVLASWCCLPPYREYGVPAYDNAAAVPLSGPFTFVRDFARDTRSEGLFLSNYPTGIQYLTLNSFSSAVVYDFGPSFLFIAIVDFIHCSGQVYGLLAAFQTACKMSFLPLTAGVPPAAATAIDVAGDGTYGNVDGVGSDARFTNLGYIAAAHTAPVWMVGGTDSESLRRVVFTGDVPLRLNVTTLIATPGKQPNGVVMTNDDSILYAASLTSHEIQVVLNPLSSSPTLGAVLAIVADGMHKISLHPGCESMLLVGCQGEYLLVYSITSQSTVHSIRALDSYSAGGHFTLAGTVLANGTVIFAGNSMSANGLASWCCLPPCTSTIKATYTPAIAPAPLAVPSGNTKIRDITYDTRSRGLFTTHDTEGIRFFTLNPLTSASVLSFASSGVFIAMVDFIHFSGPVYGLLMAFQSGYKMSFLPLTSGSPPVAGSIFDVAGDGTNVKADGVGSAARFKDMGYVICAHTAPLWIIGEYMSECIRRAVFTSDVPLRLNVTTLIATPGKQPFGVVLTYDDSKLYAIHNTPQIVAVLNPLSANPTLGPVFSITAPANMHRIAIHPACEFLFVVGCQGNDLLIYNASSQSTVRTLTAGTAGWTLGGTFLPNGTVLFSGYMATGGLASWCCLSPYSSSKLHAYAPSVPAITLPVAFSFTRDVVHDTRSGGLFSSNSATGIQYLSLNPLSSTVVYSFTGSRFIAMVDFIHCSGSVYGIMMSQQTGRKMTFLPLAPAAGGSPPVAATFIDVAGDGTDGNVDGVGSAAQFKEVGYVTAAHTAPVWIVGGYLSDSIRRAAFINDVPLRLNVTTLIITTGKHLLGVVITNDDSVLYGSTYSGGVLQVVLNPLSVNPTLGPVLSVAATGKAKISLHPGCESLLLVGCQGEYLLVYNITSQSTIQSIRALDSYSSIGNYTMAGTVLANGTVIFAGYSQSSNGLASWCCLPSYSTSLPRSYAPSIPAITVPAPYSYTRDIARDTRSEGLFASNVGIGIQYLSLNPLSSTVIFSFGWSSGISLAMVDFIHCSGPIYGILAGFQVLRKMSFLPLTPAAPGVPPVAGSVIDVAGDGTDGNLDGIGSAARFSTPGYTAGAHTAPAWIVADMGTQSIRLAVFTNDVPLRLNVTTLIATPGQQPNGVVTTNDDRILYAAICNVPQIQLVLNPLSSSPTLGPVLSIVVVFNYKISLHPGCESLLLVGSGSEYILVYNITSQSTIHTIYSLDSYGPGTGMNYTLAGTVIANGTVIFAGFSDSTKGLATWCCLPPYSRSIPHSYVPPVSGVALLGMLAMTRDIEHDTRSEGLFSSSSATGIQYLSLNPLSSTVVYSFADSRFIAMVDFIHCSGLVYGIMMSQQNGRKMSFLPLTPAAAGSPPVAGTFIDVAGNGADGNVDGVGSAARFKQVGYVAAAHTAPVWVVAGYLSESIRRAVFTSDVPLRLNVTTLIATPGKSLMAVVITHDDSVLYGSAYTGTVLQVVLNPLSTSPTLGPVLSMGGSGKHKISLHPGCESLLLVGCAGEYLLVYNITSQSTIRSIRAVDSYSSLGNNTLAGTVLANGTVIFAGYSQSSNGLASWCCLPSYSTSLPYTPSIAAVPLNMPSVNMRDIILDTRSNGLFITNDCVGIQYLSLNPLASTVVFNYACGVSLFATMVDFIHCSGPIYGVLLTLPELRKMSLLPLNPTAGAPPTAGTLVDVAGNGTDGNVDGVGSDARFNYLGFVTAAHTAPMWVVGGCSSYSIRPCNLHQQFTAPPQRDDPHVYSRQTAKRSGHHQRRFDAVCFYSRPSGDPYSAKSTIQQPDTRPDSQRCSEPSAEADAPSWLPEHFADWLRWSCARRLQHDVTEHDSCH